MKLISRKRIDKYWNISLDKITYLSLLAATAHFRTNALNKHKLCSHSTAEYARSSMRRWDGGYFKRTHIYTLKMTLMLKVLEGKTGRGSKVDICPVLSCCFSISKWLIGYLLPVRQDVFFFFANLIFSQKKYYFMCIGWVSWMQLDSI